MLQLLLLTLQLGIFSLRVQAVDPSQIHSISQAVLQICQKLTANLRELEKCKFAQICTCEFGH